MKGISKKGLIVATAAASLIASGFLFTAQANEKAKEKEEKHHGKVKCHSVDEKGKGKDWMAKDADECTAKGGTVVEEKKEMKKEGKKAE